MYAITINTDGTTGWRSIGSAEDLVSGEVLADATPLPTMADATASLTADVQAWLDQTAANNGYDSLASCISYKDSAIAQWTSDAIAAIAWRDAVWQACFQWQQSAATHPPETLPTSDEVITKMPQPEAYGWVTHKPGSSS